MTIYKPLTIKKYGLALLVFIYSFCTAQTDSIAIQKIGFKSLFVNDAFDASKAYYSQLSPKAVPFVQEYIRKQGKELNRMKEWGKPYFNLYDKILTANGIPTEMKYLSVIESHLRSGLVSWAGAVGPWQLMDYEAKRFGLKLTPIDERTDYTKSTIVAAKLMKELYTQFGDWLLVVAAYNGGAGRIRQAIRLSSSRDFWDLQLYLKEETRSHVKKFIGTHYIFEGSGGKTTSSAKEIKQLEESASTTIIDSTLFKNTTQKEIKGRYKAIVLAKVLDISIPTFKMLNPNMESILSKGEPYPLRLSKEKWPLFESTKNKILEESILLLLKGN